MEDETRIDDNAVVFKREGTYQVRVRVDGKYVYRSLKTGDLAVAIKAAQKLVHKFEFNAELGIPNSAKTFGQAIDGFVSYIEAENRHGRKSDGWLRQVKRVARFWHAYAGDKPITSIGDKELRNYVQWRRDYYTQRPNEAKKHNIKIDPTDKTLQFDIMIGKAVIKWAHDEGLRGLRPLPTYSFKLTKFRVRPAFEFGDYRGVLHAIEKWIEACPSPKYLYTRQLLFDYVAILGRSGMRVGEANNLKVRDVVRFVDGENRINYRFIVRGKTSKYDGDRDVIPVVSVVPHVERVLASKGENPDRDAWFFAMPGGTKVISLADQFDKVLRESRRKFSAADEPFSLYSLRHFYAVTALRSSVGIYEVARNMGTSVDMIQRYYGKQATAASMATKLGGKLKPKHKLNTKAD